MGRSGTPKAGKARGPRLPRNRENTPVGHRMVAIDRCASRRTSSEEGELVFVSSFAQAADDEMFDEDFQRTLVTSAWTPGGRASSRASSTDITTSNGHPRILRRSWTVVETDSAHAVLSKSAAWSGSPGCQSLPIRRFRIELSSPKPSRSQSTTTITTTAFRIDFIDPAIGMYLLMSPRRTPTTMSVSNTESKGMICRPLCFVNDGSDSTARLFTIAHRPTLGLPDRTDTTSVLRGVLLIHGELLKLGFEISERTVLRLMLRTKGTANFRFGDLAGRRWLNGGSKNVCTRKHRRRVEF